MAVGAVWTAMRPNGEAADNWSFCANWTEAELEKLVEIGSPQQTGIE